LEKRLDGSWDAGARTPLEDLEATLKIALFSEKEHDEIDTLGGLVFSIAGRVPSRGELLTHESGLEFEVLDVDPRRIKRLRVRAPHSLFGDLEDGDGADADQAAAEHAEHTENGAPKTNADGA